MQNPSKLLLLFFCLASFAKIDSCFAAEQVTITTFYPAPNGVYGELRSKRLAVGNSYYDPGQFCWPGGPCPQDQVHLFSDDTSLAVEGRVVIGKTMAATPIPGPDGRNHGFALSVFNPQPDAASIVADDVYLNNPAAGWQKFASVGWFPQLLIRNPPVSNPSNPIQYPVQASSISNRSFRVTVADDNAGQNNIFADDVYLNSPVEGAARWASQAVRTHACYADWGGGWVSVEGRNVYVRGMFWMPKIFAGNDIQDCGPHAADDSVFFFCVSEDGGPNGYTGLCLSGEHCPWLWG